MKSVLRDRLMQVTGIGKISPHEIDLRIESLTAMPVRIKIPIKESASRLMPVIHKISTDPTQVMAPPSG